MSNYKEKVKREEDDDIEDDDIEEDEEEEGEDGNDEVISDIDSENENIKGIDPEDEEEDDDDIDQENDDKNDDDNDDENENEECGKTKMKNNNNVETSLVGGNGNKSTFREYESDTDDDDEYCLQKFNSSTEQEILTDFHSEMKFHNEEEIEFSSCVTRNKDGVIIDKLHNTLAFVTKYEKTRIIGERARQLNLGAIY